MKASRACSVGRKMKRRLTERHKSRAGRSKDDSPPPPPPPPPLLEGAEEPPRPRRLEPGHKRHPRVVDSVSHLRARAPSAPWESSSCDRCAAAPPAHTVGSASAFSPPRARGPPTAARSLTRPRSPCGEGGREGGGRKRLLLAWAVTCIIRGAAREAAQQGGGGGWMGGGSTGRGWALS